MVDQVGVPGADVVKVDASGRRWYTARFKHAVVAQCQRPGMSVSKVAITHGLNTNLVRKWVEREIARAEEFAAVRAPVLLPVSVSEPTVAEAAISPDADREEALSVDCAVQIRLGEVVVLVNATARPDQIEAVLRSLR